MIAINRSKTAAFDEFTYQVKGELTMMLTYLTTLELSSRIKYDERTIRERLI